MPGLHAGTARVILVATALVCATARPVDAGPIGYSVRADTGDRIFVIDLETGKALDYGQVKFGPEGLAIFDGAVFGVDGDQSSSPHLLWDVTPSGPATWSWDTVGTVIGPTGPRLGFDAGLAEDRFGNLYNIQGAHSYVSPESTLYRIDRTTGAATFVGQAGVYADSLAINASGMAFAVDGKVTDSLYQVDLLTGALTLVGSLGLGDALMHTGLSFDPDGTLWMISTGVSAAPSQIFRIDPATGAATFVTIVAVDLPGVGTFGKNGFQSLAIAGGSGTEMVHTPEPGTLWLVGVAGLGLFRRRRPAEALGFHGSRRAELEDVLE
jgi:hypothetical protein